MRYSSLMLTILLYLSASGYAYAETIATQLTLTQAEELSLLQKYHPDIHIAYGSARPVDFENFYLKYSALKKGRKIIKPAPISAQDIKAVENDRDYHSDYIGLHQIMEASAPIDAPVYGRIYHETLPAYEPLGLPEKDVLVLKYGAVFTASGLPLGLSAMQNFFANLSGDTTIWHELDIHGAIKIILDRQTLEPMIVILAQHNYFRSYIIGADVTIPANGHLPICYAARSNEPYLCPAKTMRYPTIGDPSNLEFVLTGNNKPFLDGGYDIVSSATESQQMQVWIHQLSAEHPLYTSRIAMGDIRKLFGIIPTWFRRGSPGADLYAPKNMRDYVDLARVFYLQEGDAKIAAIIKAGFKSWEHVDMKPAFAHNADRFWGNLQRYY